jgi:hypothetical protein
MMAFEALRSAVIVCTDAIAQYNKLNINVGHAMVKVDDYEDYFEATEVARKFGVSIHTIRRRIQEKEIFKGAVKVKLGGGERWLIPRSALGSLTMEQISPKLYQERYKNKIKPTYNPEVPRSSLPSVKSLEQRVAVLERHLLKILDDK